LLYKTVLISLIVV